MYRRKMPLNLEVLLAAGALKIHRRPIKPTFAGHLVLTPDVRYTCCHDSKNQRGSISNDPQPERRSAAARAAARIAAHAPQRPGAAGAAAAPARPAHRPEE